VCFFWLLFFAQAKKSDPRPKGVEAPKEKSKKPKTPPISYRRNKPPNPTPI
jgi:hypothetical protein